ncbi:hypothetical protein [Nocardioides sp. KR10-350]|uniref:hypothetical protein n=1 Tax=Nocardioides cheoyonin TaxID=3156615 RepID=UPI0032B3EA66
MADTTTTPPTDGLRRIVLTIVGVAAILVVLLIAFALPSARSAPHDVPVGVVGTPEAAARLQLQAHGFELSMYPDEAAARTAILDRDEYGAVVLTQPGRVTTLVATAASPSVATLVERLGQETAEASGSTATVTDVRAFPSDDPHGAGLAAGALPMALGGWIGALVIMMVLRTPGHRLVAALGLAVVGGLALALTLRYVIGTIDGHTLTTSLGAMLGIGATALAVLGLRTTLGGIGLGLAAVALIVLGNPLSGLTSAPELLPDPWGALGQLLPPGATGDLLRGLAFFDGHGTARPIVVLACWLVGGAALYAYGVRRAAPRARHEAGPKNVEEEIEEALEV